MFLNRYLARVSGASISPLAEFSLRFLRSVILARVLMPSDFGAAVALATILSGFELVTDVGLAQFVVVHARENSAQAVAAAQRIALVRCFVMALSIVVLAPLLARLFGATASVTSIRWLGAVALIRGFRNWRIIQVQGDYRYAPQAVAIVVSQIASVIAIVPAAAWFQDERALVASLLLEAAIYVTLSRLLLKKERVTSIDPAIRRAAMTYGLPLMINGVGLFVLAQFDRVIVANLFGLANLALYSVVLTLAIVPTSALSQVIGSFGLPFLGRWREDYAGSRRATLILILGILIIAATYAVGVGLLLDRLVPLIYGSHYRVTQGLRALATGVAFLRLCRAGLNLILLNHSQTGRLTLGNIVSGAGVVMSFLLAIWSQRVEAVVLGLLIGDLLSLFLLFAFTSRHLPAATAVRHAGVLILPVGLAAWGPLAVSGGGVGVRVLIAAVSALVIASEAAIVYRRYVAKPVSGRAFTA